MEFRSAEDFRNAVTDCVASYTRAHDAAVGSTGSCRKRSAVKTRGAVLGGTAMYSLQCIAYLLGIAYYAIGLYRVYQEKKKAQAQKEKALDTLERLAPTKADCKSDLEGARERLSELGKQSGALGVYELAVAIYPIYRRICPQPDEGQEGLLLYVLPLALKAASKPTTVEKGDLA